MATQNGPQPSWIKRDSDLSCRSLFTCSKEAHISYSSHSIFSVVGACLSQFSLVPWLDLGLSHIHSWFQHVSTCFIPRVLEFPSPISLISQKTMPWTFPIQKKRSKRPFSPGHAEDIQIQDSLITMIFGVGAAVAAFPPVMDCCVSKLGRKGAVIFGGLVFCLGAALQALAPQPKDPKDPKVGKMGRKLGDGLEMARKGKNVQHVLTNIPVGKPFFMQLWRFPNWQNIWQCMTVTPLFHAVSTDVQVNQQLSLYISETGWTNCLWTPAVFFVSITGLVAENLHRWAKSWGESHMPTPCFAKAINMAMMLLGRIIAGFSVGLLSGNAPVYTSEIAPPALRGALVTGFQFAITVFVQHWVDLIGHIWVTPPVMFVGLWTHTHTIYIYMYI